MGPQTEQVGQERFRVPGAGEPVAVRALGGLVGVYDQHDYMTERRAALETWASFVLACEAGEPWHQNNVIPIRAAA